MNLLLSYYMKHQPVLLVILDGWGLRKETQANPIAEVHPAYYTHLVEDYPCIPLEASGEAVGLPDSQMGNSEVGHLNMGAGRVVYQELTRINKAIREGDFFKNEVLVNGMAFAKNQGTTLHLMGLVSDGGVHSSLEHLYALLDMAKQQGVENVRVHAFLDGRDVPPQSADEYLHAVEQKLMALDYPQIATICGRYYAMDRDKRWDRVERAYNNLVAGAGRRSLFSQDALQYAYNQGETDEFVLPTVCDMSYHGMEEGDSIIFFNFRPDRAREITQAFIDPHFDNFVRAKALENFMFVCMTMYDETFTAPVAFPKQKLDRILSEILSENGIHQFRTAETEKYAHVTYFLNGGFEAPFPGEERKLVPSPKVATYDLQPEMSLAGVTDEVVFALKSGQYQFIATNFANPDMIGHTGIMSAAMDAVRAVDVALEKVITTALELGWVTLLTADHGNIEMMVDENGQPHTAHTTDLVPLVLISTHKDWTLNPSRTYALSNISPTILDIMNLPKPSEMTEESVLVRQHSPVAG
jgi:2,3-bisphosphoglycerate-independent phosphoglycerate mutase